MYHKDFRNLSTIAAVSIARQMSARLSTAWVTPKILFDPLNAWPVPVWFYAIAQAAQIIWRLHLCNRRRAKSISIAKTDTSIRLRLVARLLFPKPKRRERKPPSIISKYQLEYDVSALSSFFPESIPTSSRAASQVLRLWESRIAAEACLCFPARFLTKRRRRSLIRYQTPEMRHTRK